MADDKDKLYNEYRIVLVGAGGSGKSCITNMFLTGFFTDDYVGYCCYWLLNPQDPTIEDSYIKKTQVDDEMAVLDILDTAGQEEYSAMLDDYMRNGQGFICVYSVTDRSSFEQVQKYREKLWAVKDRDLNDTLPFLLVGNKIDLEDQRQVMTSEGQDLAQKYKCEFVECSAKSNINIHEIFYNIVRQIRKDREIRGYQLRKSKGPDEKMVFRRIVSNNSTLQKQKIARKFAKWSLMKSAKRGIARMSRTISSAFNKKDKEHPGSKQTATSPKPIPEPTTPSQTTTTSSTPAQTTPQASTTTSTLYTPTTTTTASSPEPTPSVSPSPSYYTPPVESTPPPSSTATSNGTSQPDVLQANGGVLEEIESDLKSMIKEINEVISAPEASQPQTPQSPQSDNSGCVTREISFAAGATSSTFYGKIPKIKNTPESMFELCPYFYGKIGGSDVPKLLQGKAVGTFLFRYSSQPKHLAVSYVADTQGTIQSVLIGYDDTGVWMVDDSPTPIKYPTLDELVADYNETLIYPCAQPRQAPSGDKHYSKIPVIPGVTTRRT